MKYLYLKFHLYRSKNAICRNVCGGGGEGKKDTFANFSTVLILLLIGYEISNLAIGVLSNTFS